MTSVMFLQTSASAAEEGRDLRELTEAADCAYPQNFTTPSGTFLQCCYNSTLTGTPCCDAWGNPCTVLNDHPDCCMDDGSNSTGTENCWSLWHTDGVDPGNYQVGHPSQEALYSCKLV